jgi:hypothetical protein
MLMMFRVSPVTSSASTTPMMDVGLHLDDLLPIEVVDLRRASVSRSRAIWPSGTVLGTPS